MVDATLKKDFNIEEAISFGWNTMKSNFWFFFGIIWIAFGVSFFCALIMQLIIFSARHSLTGIIIFILVIIYIIAVAVNALIQMGYINVALKLCRNEKPKLSDFLSQYPLIIDFLIASLLYGLIMMAGFILLIVPGIIWGIKFQFYGYFIIEQKCGPIEALKKSSELTENIKGKLFIFGLVIYGINLLGAMAIVIGTFFALPTTLVAYTKVYRELLGQLAADKV